jgi:hypothetical protein
MQPAARKPVPFDDRRFHDLWTQSPIDLAFQGPRRSDNALNAKLRFAESKTMKKDPGIWAASAFADRRPSGLPVYSS